MSDDEGTASEGISRLKKIREQKKLEQFLSSIDVDFKPVIDTEKDRNVSDESIYELTAMQHVQRLSGKNAFVGMIVIVIGMKRLSWVSGKTSIHSVCLCCQRLHPMKISVSVI